VGGALLSDGEEAMVGSGEGGEGGGDGEEQGGGSGWGGERSGGTEAEGERGCTVLCLSRGAFEVRQ